MDYIVKDIETSIDEGCFAEPVWISSMHKMDSVKNLVHSMNRQVFTAVATGFARMQKFNTDVQFALSDHADFKQATDYIGQCNPKYIYTCGSNSETFSRNLKAYGYDAKSLKLTANITELLVNYVR